MAHIFHKLPAIFARLLMALLLLGLPGHVPYAAPPAPVHSRETKAQTLPQLTGLLAFHRYTSYESWNGKLFLYDFAKKSLTSLNDKYGWKLDQTINPHFSPDGQYLVFMAALTGLAHNRNSLDIFIWKVGSVDQPLDLTPNGGIADEDPKFSPDGKSIVFKRSNNINDPDGIYLMNADGNGQQCILSQSGNLEFSTPFFRQSGKEILFTRGKMNNPSTPEESDIYRCALDGTGVHPVVATPGVQDFYPIAWTGNRFLYARWASAKTSIQAANKHDQIYSIDLDTEQSQPSFFNNADLENADPYPLDDRYIFFSRTSRSDLADYRLYLGDMMSTEPISLKDSGIDLGDNTGKQDLGACYTSHNVLTPSGLWQATDLAVGEDNLARLLWVRPDKAFAVWTLTPSNAITSTPRFGPITGVGATALGAGGSDLKSRVLLNTTDNKGIAWTVQNPATGNITSTPAYGPYSGYTCREIASALNNTTRLLWVRSDGAFSIWTVDASGSFTSTPLFGPIAGWNASAISVGGDNKTTVLLHNIDGRASVWTIQNPATGTITSTPAFGPYSGYACRDLATGPDNKTRLLWVRSDNSFSVWAVDTAGKFTSTPAYGPISGWNEYKVAVGGDLKSRVLLNNVDGSAAVWTIDSANKVTSTPAYGPIPADGP